MRADLDHVAVAAERQADLWPRYGGDLAGAWVGGGRTVGFASAQVRFADGDGGMKLEALEPFRAEENDFLRRFLDRSGPGPHHFTFKVPSIRAALRAARARGYGPVGIDLSHPEWMEAFLHPREACGIVVQLAQSAGEWDEDDPSPLPPPRVSEPAVLSRAVLLVADLDLGRELFEGLLGGRPSTSTSTGKSPGDRVDLSWPGGGRIRLLRPEAGTPEAERLGDRPGRLDHLAFRVRDPDRVPGALAIGDGLFEVSPEANHGTRLVLAPHHA